MPKHPDSARHAKKLWRSGRPSGARAAESDATDALYGLTKPDVIGDFLRERALDGLFDDRDAEGPGESAEAPTS